MLRLAEAVALSQAELSYHAARADVRVLFIKGYSSEFHRLRDPRSSADVDVLVHPDDQDRLMKLIASLGWERRPTSLGSSLFTTHSVSFLRQGWPCDIDVHLRYPGFLQPAEEVFDVLWERRVSISVAGQQSSIPDCTSAVAIMALHSLRGLHTDPRHERELEGLRERTQNGTVLLDLNDLMSFARKTGATAPLLPFFHRLGVVVEPPSRELQSPDFEMWTLKSLMGAANSHLWLRAVLRAPLRDRPRLVRAALWPSRDDMLIADPHLPDDGAALFRARTLRLLKGMRALPRGLRMLREAHRGQRG